MELLYVERSVVIRNRGSIEFSQVEQSADIVLVDIKCEAIGGTVYYNSKTLPAYGFYGSVTLFGGAAVRERLPLEFVYQRVLDFETIYRRLRCYLTRISIRQEAQEGPSPNNYFTPLGDAIVPDSFEYRGLPYSKLKVNSERLAQYTVTVRSYTEDTGFACQSQNKPDDPTKGEDEYPNTLPIPNSGEFPGSLPYADDPYNGADPRDFPPPGSLDYGPVTIEGVGVLSFEFLRGGQGEFWRDQTNPGIGYPGQWVETVDEVSGAAVEVSWRDIAGTETPLVISNNPPIRVRNTKITKPDGSFYYPLSTVFVTG